MSPGWKLTYYKNPELRFGMAISVVPLVFEPGTRSAYSGVGYYALAYSLGQSLQNSPTPDVKELLKTRIMDPLQIPSGAWSISYGDRYSINGLRLYAIGSGSRYTPRAVARVGQFMLNRGAWNGEQLVDPLTVDAILGYTTSGDTSDTGTGPIGWNNNADGRLSSLPRDAYWGLGAGDQVLLVVPSLDLVMVRMGEPLSRDLQSGTGHEQRLETLLFGPLVEATK